LTEELKKKSIIDAKLLKPSDTHGLAAAKKTELVKMAAALGTRSDYAEGDAFNKEKQLELKEQRAEARAETLRKRAEQEKKMEEQRARWEIEKKERDRLRRRAEDRARQEREQMRNRRMSPPPVDGHLGRHKDRMRSASPPVARVRPRSQSRSPYARHHRSPSAPRRTPPRRRFDSPPRRRRTPSPPNNNLRPYRSRSRSDSPPPPSRRLSERGPPHRHQSPGRRERGRMRSLSGSPPRRSPHPRSRSGTPASDGSAMSMSSNGSDA